jgi:hypothetical protein
VRRAVLPLALAALAAVPAVAATLPAASGKDAAGDAPGAVDLVRVALVVGRDGRLRGELTADQAWTTASLGDHGSLCLRLYTARDPQADPPDWLVCATPGAGDTLVGRVLRDRVNGPPKRVADARVSRPTTRTLYVRFARTAIHDPATIRFSAESVASTSGCEPPLFCRDLAPDPPATVTLHLHRAARPQ